MNYENNYSANINNGNHTHYEKNIFNTTNNKGNPINLFNEKNQNFYRIQTTNATNIHKNIFKYNHQSIFSLNKDKKFALSNQDNNIIEKNNKKIDIKNAKDLNENFEYSNNLYSKANTERGSQNDNKSITYKKFNSIALNLESIEKKKLKAKNISAKTTEKFRKFQLEQVASDQNLYINTINNNNNNITNSINVNYLTNEKSIKDNLSQAFMTANIINKSASSNDIFSLTGIGLNMNQNYNYDYNYNTNNKLSNAVLQTNERILIESAKERVKQINEISK